MIKQISDFASFLVASIVALTIIEMLLPQNSTKKYVTFVATIILSISVINPIMSLFHNDINIEKILKQNQIEFSNDEYVAQMEYAKQKNINDMYDKALRQDIINRLEENGYKVKDIYFVVDRKSYQPIKIQVEIEHDDGDIQEVIIDVSNNMQDDITLFEIAKVKDILHTSYNIDRKNISVNHK